MAVALTVTASPVFADQAERETKRRGMLIGVLVGIGAGAVYGATNGVCRNQFGDYTQKEIVAGCVTPIGLMVAGGGLIGYFLDRNRTKSAESREVASGRRTTADETWSNRVTVKSKAPARPAPPTPRAYRHLFAPTTY
jgi:hypothetical protein